jgi:apyrase
MYLTSYFFDRAVETGLVPESATSARLRPAEFRAKADAVCRLPWKGLSDMQVRFPDVEAEHAPFVCMDLSFITSLLVDGFNIPSETELVVVKQFLYNGLRFESAWPLGAAIDTLSG